MIDAQEIAEIAEAEAAAGKATEVAAAAAGAGVGTAEGALVEGQAALAAAESRAALTVCAPEEVP